MAKINQGTIIGVIMMVLFAVVLLKMLPSLIPLASEASSDLFTTLGNNTVSYVGTDAAAFALEIPGIVGWFWVIGPVILVIGVALAMFKSGRR